MLDNLKKFKNIKIQYQDDYYKVYWIVSRNELLKKFGSLVFINIFCLWNVIFKKTNAVEYIHIIWVIMDICCIFILYLAFKFPCVRWELSRRKTKDYLDITEKQATYRRKIYVIYNIVLIGVGLFVLYIQFFVQMKE